MCRLAAQMPEWDKDRCIAEAQQEYRLGAEKEEMLGADSPTGSTGGTCKAQPPLPVNSKS